MIKDILQNNENLTSNTQTLEVLHTHFPQCFNKEGNFDIDKFKDLVKADVDVTHEGYDLNFLGKNYAKLLASVDTTTVIQPDMEHNTKPENAISQNLYISGDNLDGLKHLLKSYTGAVKCIYIDPPYNTGTDGFVYNDKFNYTNEELTNKLSISDEQAQKILDLTTKGRASHSAWLTFMYPRLLLARDLLTPDGVIFISIDDNEQANLKLLCDSVFGEENFIDIFNWAKTETPANLSKKSKKVIEYLLCYQKFKNDSKFIGLKKDSNSSNGLLNQSNNEGLLTFPKDIVQTNIPNGIITSGKYGTDSYDVWLIEDTEVSNGLFIKPVKLKAKFKWGQENLEKEILAGTIISMPTIRFSPAYEKGEYDAEVPPNLINYKVEVGTNENAGTELISLMGNKVFSFPKPVSLIKYIVNFILEKNDIVLDFFSGSGTTAEAIISLNSTNHPMQYRYILIQLPENLDKSNESADAQTKVTIQNAINLLDTKKRPHTLDFVGMERIQRAAAKIKAETGAAIDYGFKHYTLVEPSADTLDKLEEFKADEIFTNNNTLCLFGKETVLETWLVKDGYGFGAKVQEVKLANYTAHLCGKHLYFIEAGIDENDMVALLDKYQQESAFNPENIVAFGYSFNFSQTEMLRKNLFVLKDSHKNLKANFDIRY